MCSAVATVSDDVVVSCVAYARCNDTGDDDVIDEDNNDATGDTGDDVDDDSGNEENDEDVVDMLNCVDASDGTDVETHANATAGDSSEARDSRISHRHIADRHTRHAHDTTISLPCGFSTLCASFRYLHETLIESVPHMIASRLPLSIRVSNEASSNFIFVQSIVSKTKRSFPNDSCI